MTVVKAFIKRDTKPNRCSIWQWLQWRTQKFPWGGFHSVADGSHLCLVCTVCDVRIWRHIHVSKPTFWRSLL